MSHDNEESVAIPLRAVNPWLTLKVFEESGFRPSDAYDEPGQAWLCQYTLRPTRHFDRVLNDSRMRRVPGPSPFFSANIVMAHGVKFAAPNRLLRRKGIAPKRALWTPAELHRT